MNDLQVFTNENFSVRTLDDDGQIWFVAKDIMNALEYSETSTPAQVMQAVPGIWKGIKRIDTSPVNSVIQTREMLCLTEQGLYFFLGRSDKKKALPYQMWIAGDVVPSIRKHGLYATPQAAEKILNDPDVFIKVLQALKDEREKSNALQAQIDSERPKVIFAEAVDASKGSVLIGVLAKILNQNGCTIDGKPIGQNRFFAWLRDNDYLHRCKCERYNLPKQWAVDKGLFEVKKSIINNPDGSIKTTHTTKVTGKGQIFFVDFFMARKN